MPDYLVHAHIVFLVTADNEEAARQTLLQAVRSSEVDCQGIGSVTGDDVFIEELESFIETDQGSAVLLEN